MLPKLAATARAEVVRVWPMPKARQALVAAVPGAQQPASRVRVLRVCVGVRCGGARVVNQVGVVPSDVPVI